MLALFDLHPFFFFKEIFVQLSENIYNSTGLNFSCIESGLTTPLRADIDVIRCNEKKNSFLVWSHLRLLSHHNLEEFIHLLLPFSSEVDRVSILNLYYRHSVINFKYGDINIICKNLARWDFENCSIGSLFDYIERVSRFWAAYYIHYGIKIIFGHICHSGEDLIGQITAKYLGLNFYSFNISCTDGIFVLDNQSETNVELIDIIKNDCIIRSHHKYIKSKTLNPSIGLHNSYSKLRNDFNLRHNKSAQIANYKLLLESEENHAALHLSLLLQEYIKISLPLSSICHEDDHLYVLFLQMQPEATTVPCALEFNQQINLIRHVRTLIPSDAKLLVKEHFAQFYVYHEIPHVNDIDYRTIKDNRPLNFYSEISNIPNTFLLDLHTPSAALLGSKTTLFTSVGTSGIEFFLSGSKVYQFKSWSPYYQFLHEYGTKDLPSVERTELLTSYFDNYTFEISQFIGVESTHTNREIFSTQFYEECSPQERIMVTNGLSDLITELVRKSGCLN